MKSVAVLAIHSFAMLHGTVVKIPQNIQNIVSTHAFIFFPLWVQITVPATSSGSPCGITRHSQVKCVIPASVFHFTLQLLVCMKQQPHNLHLCSTSSGTEYGHQPFSSSDLLLQLMSSTKFLSRRGDLLAENIIFPKMTWQ